MNLPNSATVEDVAETYTMAHRLGCLGITVFRDGCKGEQVLHIAAARRARSRPKSWKPRQPLRRRLNRGRGWSTVTYRAETPPAPPSSR